MKFTKATFKRFIKDNEDKLLIKTNSSFDGMIDCVREVKDVYKPIQKDMRTDEVGKNNTLGIKGVWLVGNSDDYFTPWEDDHYIGVHVYNCCGSFDLAILK